MSKRAMARTPSKPTPVLVSATRTLQRIDNSVHSAPLVRSSATKNIRGPVSVLGNRVNPSSLAKPPAIVKVTAQSDTDDFSEVSSVNSSSVGVDRIKGPSLFNEPQLNPLTEDLDESPVSKLRPNKPVISSVGETVLSVAQMFANKRGDASLIVD